MDLNKKIEKLGGIEIISVFESKKDLNFDIDNYLSENNIRLPKEYIDFSQEYGFGQFNWMTANFFSVWV